MNKGVELLIERMETHPEEFMENYEMYRSDTGKWDNILHQLFSRVEQIDIDNGNDLAAHTARKARQNKSLAYLSDEEVMTLFHKLMEVRSNLFNQVVMGVLLGDSHNPAEGTEANTYTTYPVTTSTAALGRIVRKGGF